MPTLRAEHGLAHWVEVTRGKETRTIAFDWGLTGDSYCHNFVELELDPGAWMRWCCHMDTRTTSEVSLVFWARIGAR